MGEHIRESMNRLNELDYLSVMFEMSETEIVVEWESTLREHELLMSLDNSIVMFEMSDTNTAVHCESILRKSMNILQV